MGQGRTEGAGQQQLDTGHRTAREEPKKHPVLCFPAEKSYQGTAFSTAPQFKERATRQVPLTDFDIISVPLLSIIH